MTHMGDREICSVSGRLPGNNLLGRVGTDVNGCEAAGDLVLKQTLLLLSCKLCCCKSRLQSEKQKSLHQNRVTGSLASILRPLTYIVATTVEWTIFKSLSSQLVN